MKKALFVATVDIHIRSFHLPYLKLLHDMGYEVHVATNGTEKFPNCDKKHTVCMERSPLKINNLKAIRQLRKIVEEEKYDLIHCHTPMGAVVARLAAKNARKKYRTRVIYTAHGFHFWKGAPLINWLIFYPIEKYLAKYTDTLITINTEDFERAKKKFSKRCHDIQYVRGIGLDEKKFCISMSKKQKKNLRNSLELKIDDYVIIYPAEISKRKRQIWLISALSGLLKKNKNIHILLVGSDLLNGEAKKISNKLGVSSQMHFLGYRNDISRLLKISNLLVSASSQEGLPVNVMEAMSVGVPIVATDCRGNSDLIRDGINGYIINKNESIKFSECVEKMYMKKNNLFVLNGKKMIKNYSAKKIMPIMKKIYSNYR